MSEAKTHGFETLQIHAGAMPDATTGARQTPIYQTTAFAFRDVEHAAALFDLKEVGYIYSRLTNPTVSALGERIATLEGGIGAVCCSSGHAAQIMALFPLMQVGNNVVVSNRLYGGSITQFSQTIKRFGWSAKFVDFDDMDAVAAAIDDDTRAVFCEGIANPAGHLKDVAAVAKVADQAGLPLIVDNTTATPYLSNPIEIGCHACCSFNHQISHRQRHCDGWLCGRQWQIRLVSLRKIPVAHRTRRGLSRAEVSRDFRAICFHIPRDSQSDCGIWE